MSANFKDTSGPLAEISNGPSSFESFLDRNQKGIVALAALIAIGAVGTVIYRGVKHSHEESAGAALSKAADVSTFQSVVDTYPDTKAAGSALVLLADSQWDSGKKDESIATLQKFVSGNAGHAALPTAKANLGSKLLAQGKSGDAAKVFEELVSDSSAAFIAPFALISLGDIAKTSGDIAKAEESYNKAKTEYPESAFVDSANRRLASLKAKAPVEIEAPAVPETPLTPGAAVPGMPPGITLTPEPASETPAPPSETPAPEASAPTEESPVETPAAPAPNP